MRVPSITFFFSEIFKSSLEKAEKYLDSLRSIHLLKLREMQMDALEDERKGVTSRNREWPLLAKKILATFEFYGLFDARRNILLVYLGSYYANTEVTCERDLASARK